MENTNSASKGYLFPLVVIGVLFFMIGFALGINGLIIPFLRTALDLTTAESYLVLAATFSTFVIFGYPCGLIIKAIGYKKTMILSFLFLPSDCICLFHLPKIRVFPCSCLPLS